MADQIRVQQDWRPHVTAVTLNRPDKSNALTAALARRLVRHIEDAEDRPGVRCVVIRGTGRSFSAGADLDEMASDDPDVVLRVINAWTRAFLAIRMSMLPILTVVHGACVGGGYHLNLASDYTIAGEGAWFRHTGVDAGIPPMLAGTMMLPTAIGWKRASGMVLRPRRIDAAEALALGLCSEVVAERDLEAVAAARAEEMAARDPLTVALGKAEMNAAMGSVFSSAVLSQLAGYLHAVTPDGHARLKAYRQAVAAG